MAVTLLKLSTGLTSLEFREDDWGAVKDEVRRRFGDITVNVRGLDDVISFGGEQFRRSILEDEPHLIADTTAGSAMLEEIAAALGKDGRWVATPADQGPPPPPRKRGFSKLVLGAALVAAIVAITVA